MAVGRLRKFLDVQHRESGVCNGFAEDALGVGPESGVQLLRRTVRGDEGAFHAHLRHGDGDQVEGAAVDAGGGHDVVSAAGDVKQGEEVGRLAGGGEHRRRTALQRGDLRRHIVVGGFLKPGVEIAVGLQVEQLAHVLGGSILEGGGLHNGDLTGLTVAGSVAALDADGFDFLIAHDFELLSV